MSRRVQALVCRAGGTLREDLTVDQLAAVHGREWAERAVHHALWDEAVHRGYADGVTVLVVPDAEPRQ
jgi:hypothetical protein